MFEFVKDASIQLNNLNNNEIVKVAAVVRRLMNWFKQLGNEEYKKQIQKLRNDSVSVNIYLNDLSKHLYQLQSAIKDTDVESYEHELDEVKFLAKQLITELESLEKTTQNAEIKTQQPEQKNVEKNINISTNRLGYDVPIGSVNKPYKSFKHFNQISAEEIIINSAAQERIKLNIKTAFARKNIDDKATQNFINSNNFYIVLKEAITNGMILENNPAIDQKKQRPEGQMYVKVRTVPFSVPGFSLKLQATALLTDLFAQKSPRLKLSLMRLTNIDVEKFGEDDKDNVEPNDIDYGDYHDHMDYGDAKDIKISKPIRKKLLRKFANLIPRTYTPISPVRFAEIMSEAYKTVYGQYPTAQMLGMLWAQAAIESGSDKGFGLMNNNVGNISVGLKSSWVKSGKPYVHFRSTEFSPAGKGKDTDMYFKAFPTPLDGAVYYLNYLKSNYPNSIAAPGQASWKGAGMVFDDAVYLASKNYYTANIPLYAKGMDRYFANFMKNILPKLSLNLVNQPAPPPGPSEQYRKYRKEVASDNPALERPESKSSQYGWQGKDIKQQEQFVNQEKNQYYAQNDIPNMDSEFGELMNYLYKAAGPLDNLVKIALENKLLEKNQVLIKINSYEHFYNNIDYACVLTDILKQHLNINSIIHSNGKNVELNCFASGKSKTIIKTINSISDIISKAFYKKRNKIIFSTIQLNTISKLAEIDITELEKNHRKIYLEIM